MAEALWVQASGVEYSAAEDRRLISAIWTTPGVIDGLTVSPGTGLKINVSAGRAVVPDNETGAYLASFDAATNNIDITANAGAPRVDGIYVTVDYLGSGDAIIEVVDGDTPLPTNPYVKIATVTVGTLASTISAGSISNIVRSSATDPRYVKRTELAYGTSGQLPATLPVGSVFMVHD